MIMEAPAIELPAQERLPVARRQAKALRMRDLQIGAQAARLMLVIATGALVCLFAGTLAARSAERPALKSEARVENDVVLLGDLIEGAGAKASLALFRAPGPGETGTIQAARVASAAREAGLGEIDFNGLAQIVVVRPGRQASRAEVDAVLAEAIGERVGLPAADLAFLIDLMPSLPVSPKGRADLAVTDLWVDRANRRFALNLVTLSASGRRSAPVRLVGSYYETALVPILTRNIERGDALRADDVSLERRDKTLLAGDPALDPATLPGMAAKRALKAGTLLRDGDLSRPVLVERGSQVTMVYQSGGLSLSLKAKAMDSGGLGETVSIQNPASKRIVQGTVMAQGLVKVEGTAQTRTVATAAEAAVREVKP